VGFPRFAGKHAHAELLSPEVMRAWRATRGMLPERVPPSVVLLYQNQLWDAVLRFEMTTPIGGLGFYGQVVTLDRTAGEVGVIGGFGIGAPVAAVILEDLIAIGVRRFLSIGTAGGLQLDLAPGDIVLCTAAVRDEGVSHHYTDFDTPAEADAELTDRLERAINTAALPVRRGTTWTIDTPYRETVAEARHYQASGVQCVEMEAAALFTVARHRGAALGAAFCISDSLADAEWSPLFDHPDLAHNLLALYGAAVDALTLGSRPDAG
jgi:purine-nucleoside phosphorylase